MDIVHFSLHFHWPGGLAVLLKMAIGSVTRLLLQWLWYYLQGSRDIDGYKEN